MDTLDFELGRGRLCFVGVSDPSAHSGGAWIYHKGRSDLRSRLDSGDRAFGGAVPLLLVRAVVRTVPPGPAGGPVGRPAHEREGGRSGIIALEHHCWEGTG